ncbi:hypothetical protein [Gordonia sputi]|uniref:hypothetical protein n=1 Tax=Gordonia sputi TaxID=36823 RepID=UPI00226F3E63|nr:hypothetical protein [Gordonia sputi]
MRRAAIVAGALGERTDLFLGWKVRERRRWGVRVVVDEQGREWPVGSGGVQVLQPGDFQLTVGVRDGVRYPAAVGGVAAQGVSDVADADVDAAVRGGCGGGGVQASQAAAGLVAGRPVVGDEPVTGDIDIGEAKGTPPGATRRRPLFHSESLASRSSEHVGHAD